MSPTRATYAPASQQPNNNEREEQRVSLTSAVPCCVISTRRPLHLPHRPLPRAPIQSNPIQSRSRLHAHDQTNQLIKSSLTALSLYYSRNRNDHDMSERVTIKLKTLESTAHSVTVPLDVRSSATSSLSRARTPSASAFATTHPSSRSMSMSSSKRSNE